MKQLEPNIQLQKFKLLVEFWLFSGVTLVIMIITGIALAMNYTAHVDHAFDSVERIMRDVNGGWLIRYIHMNGASFFFIVVYIHMAEVYIMDHIKLLENCFGF